MLIGDAGEDVAVQVNMQRDAGDKERGSFSISIGVDATAVDEPLGTRRLDGDAIQNTRRQVERRVLPKILICKFEKVPYHGLGTQIKIRQVVTWPETPEP